MENRDAIAQYQHSSIFIKMCVGHTAWELEADPFDFRASDAHRSGGAGELSTITHFVWLGRRNPPEFGNI